MIYVDLPKFKKVGGKKSYSHMVADTKEELVLFANSIGVKPHFWHSQGDLSHYDITEVQFKLAKENGAQVISSKDIVRNAKRMNVQITPKAV